MSKVARVVRVACVGLLLAAPLGAQSDAANARALSWFDTGQVLATRKIWNPDTSSTMLAAVTHWGQILESPYDPVSPAALYDLMVAFEPIWGEGQPDDHPGSVLRGDKVQLYGERIGLAAEYSDKWQERTGLSRAQATIALAAESIFTSGKIDEKKLDDLFHHWE
jgi:hypothetical protein